VVRWSVSPALRGVCAVVALPTILLARVACLRERETLMTDSAAAQPPTGDVLLDFTVTNEALPIDKHRLAVARDAILCAATNLESPQPQQVGPEGIARLRAAADLLVKLDREADTYIEELGNNARGEMLTTGYAILLKRTLREIAIALPDYYDELRQKALQALGDDQ
jgi:hypothetical protein